MGFFWKRVSAADAEELTQEVFLGVYRRIREGGGPTETDATGWRRYLYSCARNQVIDHWRRKGVRPPMRSLENLIGDEASVAPAGEHTAAEALTIDREHHRAIRDCMGTLEVRSRAACWLLFVEERSKREIARLMGKPESSVRALLAEAIGLLRTCLEMKGVTVPA